MQQPGGSEAPMSSAVPNPTQMSREAKHIRVMLMLCAKEKVFDQNTMESVFAQYLQCEQQNESPEETEAAFRRAVGRTYGPRSKDYLNAIDRAKIKLEQLKERKSKGELNTGAPLAPPSHTIGGASANSFMGQPVVGAPPNQHIPQMQQNPQQQFYKSSSSHPSIGQPLPHIQPGASMIAVQQNQGYKAGALPISGVPGQYPHQQLPPQHLQHAPQYPHQQQQQHHPQHQQQMQHLPSSHPQQLSQQHPHLTHQQPPAGINQQQFMYDHRPPNLINPSLPPTSHMNPANFPSHVNMDPQRPPSHPSYMDDDGRTEDKKKTTKKKAMSEELLQDESKKKKPTDSKKARTDSVRPGGTPLGMPFSQPDIRHPTTIAANPVDDLDNITEKPNLGQEGLQTTDKGIMSGYVIDGNLLSKEEFQARQMMRENIGVGISSQIDPSAAVPTNVELEPWMEVNVVGKDILEKIMQNVLDKRMEFGSEARKVLSDGIQSHLKTIVEGAFEIGRKRLNRSAFVNHYELFQQLKANDGNPTEHHLSRVGMKWGANVAEILAEEEKKLQQFYKDYSEIDEEKLKEKMRNFDDERNKIAGTKRKIGAVGISLEIEPQINWWEKDQSLENEGVLSYEKIAEVWKKDDVAIKHELGPYMKKKSQKKAEPVPASQLEALSGGNKVAQQGKDSSIPMETETSKEDEWKDQKCPIEIPSRAFVTSEDIHYLISKMNAQRGSLIGSRSTRENVRKSKFQYKLFSQ